MGRIEVLLLMNNYVKLKIKINQLLIFLEMFQFLTFLNLLILKTIMINIIKKSH